VPLSDLLIPAAILPALRRPNKSALIAALVQRASSITGLPQAAIADAVTEREALGTTGFGGGIALPHGRLAGLAHSVGVFGRLDPPVAYDALDHAPVDLAFLLLSPDGAGAEPLKALARVSRLFRDRALCAKLRGANNADSLFALLAGVPEARAA